MKNEQSLDGRKFVFLINYGIEYRVFFSAGLYDEIEARGGEVSVWQRAIPNRILQAEWEKRGIIPREIEPTLFDRPRSRPERYFQAIRQARMRRIGLGTFRNYNPKNSSRMKELLLGNKLLYTSVKAFVDRWIPRRYRDRRVRQMFREEGITDLVISGYASVGSVLFAVNALECGVRVWTMVNSWKDFFINDYVPFRPRALFVWSETMKHDYLRMNAHLRSERVIPSGYLPYDALFQGKVHLDDEAYRLKYRLPKEAPLLLYTMLDPERYPEEPAIIEMIARGLAARHSDTAPILLVKKNPYDVSDTVERALAGLANVRVVEHFSERDKERDFFVQSTEGEMEWRDLLRLVSATIGAASTVALESLIMHRPVITVAFGAQGGPCPVLKEMSEAPFYRRLSQRKDVLTSQTVVECLDAIDDVLTGKIVAEKSPPRIVGSSTGKALEIILREMSRE